MIKSPTVIEWIRVLQEMQLSLPGLSVYPLPGNTANSVWGCMVVFETTATPSPVCRYEFCQQVTQNLFIPEKSILFPPTVDKELQKLFSSGIFVMHPEFGTVQLGDPLDFRTIVEVPASTSINVTAPSEGLKIPGRIRSFQVHRVKPDEVLENMDKNIFPKHEKMKDDSLSFWEKVKLMFYRSLFSKTKTKEGTKTEETSGGKTLKGIFTRLFNNKKWSGMQDDFEDLEARNQKEVDKLVDLLKKNPDEALKYAIPLDGEGVTRGGRQGKLDLSKRWFDFSLLQQNRSNGSGVVSIGDHFNVLRQQYIDTAQELVNKNEYQKAAFVYMKLLKDYVNAAAILEKGKYYSEAATIYLKHVGNIQKAAECYENGNMMMDAIDLYKKLQAHERVGDLYMKIDDRTQAMIHYNKVVQDHKASLRYIKASLLSSEKMNDMPQAQDLLLEGWARDIDGINCLGMYFSNIESDDHRWKEITRIHTQLTPGTKVESFLGVLKREFRKQNTLSNDLRDLAYEVAAENLKKTPSVVSELKDFNVNDHEFRKDAIRFKLKKGE